MVDERKPSSNNMKETSEVVSKSLLDIFEANTDDSSSVPSAAKNPLVLKAINKLKKKRKNRVCSEDLKSVNNRFLSGHLPRLKPGTGTQVDDGHESDDDDDDDEDIRVSEEEKKSSGFAKIVKLQLNFLSAVPDYALKYASKYGNTWLRVIIPTNQIATLASFLVYTYILNADFLLFILPLLLFVIAFIVMVISTLQSLRNEKRFKEFVAWSDLLVSVDSTLNVADAEDNYFKNHISPLLSLPCAVLLAIMSFSVAPIRVLPLSELALLSFCLFAASYFFHFRYFDKISNYTIAMQILASFLEGLQRLSPDSSPVFSFALASFNEIQLNLSLSVLLRFASAATLLSMPFRFRFRSIWVGVLRGVVPVLFVSLWWEMFSLFFIGSSLGGILRAAIGTAVLFCSVPLTLLVFLFTVFRWLLQLNMFKMVIIGLIFTLPLFLFAIFQPKIDLASAMKYMRSKLGPALRILAMVAVLSLVIALVAFYRPSGLEVHHSSLTWREYRDICFSKEQSQVVSKRLCHQLKSHKIDWNGTVKEIRIASIENKFESVIYLFPAFLANWLTCVYGEEYVESNDLCKDPALGYSSQPCFVKTSSLRKCHLDYYNRYEFVVAIQHSDDVGGDSLQVKVLAGNRFSELLFLLRPPTRVNYKGLLRPDAGTVLLEQLDVLESNFKRRKQRSSDVDFSTILDQSGKGIIRFLFSPFLSYRRIDD